MYSRSWSKTTGRFCWARNCGLLKWRVPQSHPISAIYRKKSNHFVGFPILRNTQIPQTPWLTNVSSPVSAPLPWVHRCIHSRMATNYKKLPTWQLMANNDLKHCLNHGTYWLNNGWNMEIPPKQNKAFRQKASSTSIIKMTWWYTYQSTHTLHNGSFDAETVDGCPINCGDGTLYDPKISYGFRAEVLQTTPSVKFYMELLQLDLEDHVPFGYGMSWVLC